MKENKFRCHFSIVIENAFSAIWLVVLLAMGEIIDEVKNIRKGYLQGRYGAMPFVGDGIKW